MVATPEKLEFRHFIPTTFSSDECSGEDAGSREEMGAFLTKELTDSHCVSATGEDWGMEGGAATEALARLQIGVRFVSKSMSSKYFLFMRNEQEELKSSWMHVDQE